MRIAAAELPAGDAERALRTCGKRSTSAQDCDRGDLMVQAALGFEDASWRLGLPGDDAERILREVLPRVDGRSDAHPCDRRARPGAGALG